MFSHDLFWYKWLMSRHRILFFRFRNSMRRKLSGSTMTRTSCLSRCSWRTASLTLCWRTPLTCWRWSTTRGPRGKTARLDGLPVPILNYTPLPLPLLLDELQPTSRRSVFHQLMCQQQTSDAFSPGVTSRLNHAHFFLWCSFAEFGSGSLHLSSSPAFSNLNTTRSHSSPPGVVLLSTPGGEWDDSSMEWTSIVCSHLKSINAAKIDCSIFF